MSDTVRIERPMFSRREKDNGGRIKLDPRGDLVLVKTRASDSEALPDLTAPSHDDDVITSRVNGL